MCRFLAYSGRPVLMHDLLYGPKNSLIKQSINAHEAEEPLNGDGFGIGWYNHDLDSIPGVYTSIRPAWNDRNLSSLSKKIRANCFFAHVRAASTGEVTESNCHPFAFKNYLFMHNGGIEDFQQIKRFLRRKLSDDIYGWLRGQTDSEHLFGLFLNNLFKEFPNNPTALQMAMVMKSTIDEILAIKEEFGIESDNYINLAVSDGKNIIALRYVTRNVEKASTLYYSEGSRYECSDGICRMAEPTAGEQQSVLIVSEKLTSVRKDWKEVPVNNFMLIDEKQNVTLVSFDDLQKEIDIKKSA